MEERHTAPGGKLPLNIFEPRYLDMLSHCMKDNAPFGVLLIRDEEIARQCTNLEIMTEGPLGGAGFGNEFGRPNIVGLRGAGMPNPTKG